MASKLSLFLVELKRRKVTRVAVAYALVGIGVVEGADIIGAPLGLPAWVIPTFSLLVVFGFPIALVLAWALEVTPQGIQKTPDLTPEELASHAPVKWRASSWVLAGLALIVVSAAVYTVFFRGESGSGVATEEHRVAVLPLDNLTGDPSLDTWGRMAADWVTEGLWQTELFKVVPFNEVLATSEALANSGNAASSLALAWPEETGATMAVLGSYSRLGDSIEFRLSLVATDGTVLAAMDPVMAVETGLPEALGRLQGRVVGSVAKEVAPGHDLVLSTFGRTPPLPDAHEAFLQGLVSRGGAGAAALVHYQRAVELDPEYLAPYLMMAPTLRNLRRYNEAESVCQVINGRTDELNREDRALARIFCSPTPVGQFQAARDMAEWNPGILYSVALYAFWSNRPQAALDACARYDPSFSRFTRQWANNAWAVCARSLHLLGDYEGQLAFITEKREAYPGRWKGPETDGLIALRRFDEATRLIEERLAALGPGDSPVEILNLSAQEFDVHEGPDVAIELWNQALHWLSSRPSATADSISNRRQRAEILLYLERDEEARELLEKLTTEDPEDLPDAGRLGVARARLGDRAGAEQTSETLVALSQPFLRGDPYFWRACIAASLGDRDEAVQLLDRAIDEGLQFRLNLHRDPFLKALRGYEPFERLIEPKG